MAAKELFQPTGRAKATTGHTPAGNPTTGKTKAGKTTDRAQMVCDDGSCPVARAVSVLDGKWTMLVVRDLLGGAKRFGDLRSSLGGVSPKTLIDRLRALEEAGLLTRTMYPEIPPRVEYELTAQGQALTPVIEALGTFGLLLDAG